MNKKNYLTLDNDFIRYCEINDIEDFEKLAKEVFDKGFSILKYGETPSGLNIEPKIIEKIVTKIEYISDNTRIEELSSKIIELEDLHEREITTRDNEIKKLKSDNNPVEVIKEIINTEDIDRLTKENEELKSKIDLMTKSIESFGRKGKIMKNSDMLSLYAE
jgi:SpoVK/Ycf46/Vps4 family AAA+-type ATPase